MEYPQVPDETYGSCQQGLTGKGWDFSHEMATMTSTRANDRRLIPLILHCRYGKKVRILEALYWRFAARERHTALLFGPPGDGKNDLGSAIGHALIDVGYRVLFKRTSEIA
jgi:hypothetical protein